MKLRVPSLAECSVLLLIATLVIATLILSYQERHARDVVLNRTLDNAAILAQFTKVAHVQYSESTAGAHGSGAMWTSADEPDAGRIHYPATFSRLLTEELSETLKDTKFRIYSTDPFSTFGTSEFERAAVAALSEGARDSFWRVEIWPGDMEVLRYATPIRMDGTCSACHGGASTKGADSEGEVRGLWEVGIELPATAYHSPPERAMLVGLVFLCSALGLLVVYPVVKHEVERRAHFESLSDDLMELAETDQLSGLANRRAFDEALAHVTQPSQDKEMSIGLIMLDIDHFKSVNDTYGHDVGDMVIRELGEIIRETIRTCDLAARIGGEEFAVICPDVRPKDLSRISERLRAEVEARAIESPGGTIHVTTSVGAAMLAANEDRAGLFRRADKLLMEAKQTGRNMVCLAVAPA